MKIFAIGVSLAALCFAVSPASAQQSIAADGSFKSPLPFFKDLGAWDPNYKPPRTPDGKPDLQGVWSSASLTTMTRNGQNGTNSFSLVIPQEKIDEITRNSYYNVRLRNDNKVTAADATGGDGKGGGDVKGYNNFWIDPGSEYAKVDGQWRSSWITEPASGQIPYSTGGRTALGARMASANSNSNTGYEIRGYGDRCLISFGNQGGPPLNNAMYNNHIQIVQTPTHVMLDIEMNHDARIIRLKDEKTTRLPEEIKPWFGDSVGWWEGDTLVVETRNLHPMQARGRIPLSKDGKVIERFRRVSDKEIDYQFAVDDPTNYSQVWKGQMPLRRSEEKVFEYACHEGNYALPGILRGMAQGIDTALDQDGE